jgi:formate dehydrogenase major subunit
MSPTPSTAPDRRDFLRFTTAGGFALGGLLGLGFDLRAAKEQTSRFKFTDTTEVPSVCPYCAVGCGQLVAVRPDASGEKKIVNIEGNPDSPVNRGTLCPKGAATYQLAVNDNRLTRVWYRAPRTKEWDKTKTLDWAMDRIAELVMKTRDNHFVEKTDKDLDGNPIRDAKGKPLDKPKLVNHTLAIASLGGATMDNEWNYLQTKLLRGLGVVSIENQARI